MSQIKLNFLFAMNILMSISLKEFVKTLDDPEEYLNQEWERVQILLRDTRGESTKRVSFLTKNHIPALEKTLKECEIILQTLKVKKTQEYKNLAEAIKPLAVRKKLEYIKQQMSNDCPWVIYIHDPAGKVTRYRSPAEYQKLRALRILLEDIPI